MTTVGGVLLLVYALLMGGGGIAGYVVKQSKPSLISGIASGILLVFAFLIARANPRPGFGLGALVALVLTITFGRGALAHNLRDLGLCLLSLVFCVLFCYFALSARAA